MFNVGDTVIIKKEGIYNTSFTIDKIESVENNIVSFINTNFSIDISTKNACGFSVMPYEEGIIDLKKHKVIVKINKISDKLCLNDAYFECFTEEELNRLYSKVLDLKEEMEKMNKRYLTYNTEL